VACVAGAWGRALSEAMVAKKAAVSWLSQVLTMGQAMYSQPGSGAPGDAAAGAPGAEGKPGGDDTVVDAEFTDSSS
jgi:hypothetical protein